MKPWPHGALVLYLVVLAFGVFTPHPPPVPLPPGVEPRPPDGLVADAIRNLVLMMPLGWLLAALGRGARFAAVCGLLLSLAIELTQFFVPGRFPSAVDVVTNTLSAAAGALLYATRRRWLAPEPAAARRLAIGLTAAAVAGLVVGIQLLRPSPGRPGFDAGWRPELGQYEPYPGRVLGARLGSMSLPVGRLADPSRFLRALASDAPLVVSAELRPSRIATAPIFTVHDADQNEVLLVAAQGDDLLFEQRTRALDFGLEQPAHRWSGVLAQRGGDPIELRIDRSASSARLSLADRLLGGRAWPPGRVWGLLIPGRIVRAPTLEALLDGATIGLLALPCAYHAARLLPVAGAFGAVLLALPWIGPVAPPGAPEWLGLLVGLVGGRVARVVRPSIVVLTSKSRISNPVDEERSCPRN